MRSAAISLMILVFSVLTAHGGLLRCVEQWASRVYSAKGKFTQLTVFPDGSSKVYKGIFYIKKDKTKWIYLEPVRQVVLSVGRKVFIYDPEEETIQQAELGFAEIFSGNFFNFGKLKKSFFVKEQKGKLILIPRDPESQVEKIAVQVDETGEVRSVTTFYRSGGKCSLSFSNVKYNMPIPDRFFSLESIRNLRDAG